MYRIKLMKTTPKCCSAQFFGTFCCKMLLFGLIVLLISDFSLALRNVSVSVPTAIKRGDKAVLICNYNLEEDNLYSVKWYRGRREFYRYTPKENPALKIFPVYGIFGIDSSLSNATHVHILNPVSGKYTCEVSADAPSFDTLIMSAEMEVVELPTQRPIITGIHSRYRLGDIINGNCSSDYSKPAANLTWWINDVQVPPNYVRTYGVQRHLAENLESAVLEINFIVTLQHFIKGRLKLKCAARLYDIYAQESEKLIEEDRPRILASGRSPDLTVYAFDPAHDGFDQQNELYLTHLTDSAAANLRPSFPFICTSGLCALLMLALSSTLLLHTVKTIIYLQQNAKEKSIYNTQIKFNENTAESSILNVASNSQEQQHEQITKPYLDNKYSITVR